jgi:hypothetical protein
VVVARTLGPYELLRPLAQGGMAEVFLARRVSGGVEKRLVIKRIRRERASDPRFVAMFVEEARLSMGLMHKNIVPVFDFGRAGDELFLAMELVDGPDLGAILDHARGHDTRLDPMLVAYIALEACQALDYAHHATAPDGSPRPLVHRDVTPRNVLMSRAGDVKLVDFGVASSEATLNVAGGSLRGTPAYMAPEQARGQAVDGRADVFALGLVMWEALAGRRAYEGRTQQALLAQARAAEVPPLPVDEPGSEPGARVPDALRRIVARATAADPAARFASARAMQLALDEYLVAARAAASSAPPGHLLAAWIAERFPLGPRVTGREIAVPEVAIDAPAGRVVTFLDDGAGSVLGDPDQAAVRSLAETVAEAGDEHGAEHGADMEAMPQAAADPMADTMPAGALPPPAAEGPGLSRTPAAARARGRRGWVLATAAGLAATLAVGLAVLLAVAQGRPHDPAPAGPAVATAPAPAAGTTALAPSARVADAGALDAAVAPPGHARAPAGAAPGDVAASRPKLPSGASPGAHPGRPTQHATRHAHGTTPGTTPAAAPAPGTVKISATPWARVTVAGSNASCNETPCVLQLPAGKHTLRLENPVAGLSKERLVDLAPGQTLVIRETLGP